MGLGMTLRNRTTTDMKIVILWNWNLRMMSPSTRTRTPCTRNIRIHLLDIQCFLVGFTRVAIFICPLLINIRLSSCPQNAYYWTNLKKPYTTYKVLMFHSFQIHMYICILPAGAHFDTWEYHVMLQDILTRFASSLTFPPCKI